MSNTRDVGKERQQDIKPEVIAESDLKEDAGDGRRTESMIRTRSIGSPSDEPSQANAAEGRKFPPTAGCAGQVSRSPRASLHGGRHLRAAACGAASRGIANAAPLSAFLVPISAQLFCFGFVMPSDSSLAMEPIGRIAGSASSFVGAVTTSLAAFLGWIVGQGYDGTAWPLTLGFVAFGAAGLAATYVMERGRLFQAIERDGTAEGIQRERHP